MPLGSYVGLRLIKSVAIEIGGQLIDRHYSDWMFVWSELSLPQGQYQGFAEMVGADIAPNAPATELTIPLDFWFCKNIGLAIPLVALQYHDIRVKVEFAALADLLQPGFSGNIACLNSSPAPTLQASLWCDFIFLDTDERRRYSVMTHEMLIEQVQAHDTNIKGAHNQYPLPFNNPVKELVWTVSPADAPAWNFYGFAPEPVITPTSTLRNTNDTGQYTTSPLTLYGGTTPFTNKTGNTHPFPVTIPDGWSNLTPLIVGNNADDSYVPILDVGFDLFVNGSNVRSQVEVFTDGFVKFDGQGQATYGAEYYAPDDNTPRTRAFHFGSLDNLVKVIASRNISENGLQGLVIRYEADYYAHEVQNDRIYFAEITLFSDSTVRLSTNGGINCPWYINGANFGLSDGSRWVCRIDNPLDMTVSYTMSLNLTYTPWTLPTLSKSPTVVVFREADDAEGFSNIVNSKFQVGGTIIETSDPAFGDIATRPDVVSLYAVTNVNNIDVVGLSNWVSNGTFLFVQGDFMSTNPYNDEFGILQGFDSLVELDDATYANVSATSTILTEKVLSYNHEYKGIPISQLAPGVEVHATYSVDPTIATVVGKQLGSGYVLWDLAHHEDTYGWAGIHYRIGLVNDIFNFVAFPQVPLPTRVVAPIDSANIVINNRDRMAVRPSSYYALAQPHQHHTRIPRDIGIYSYSFALFPEDYQPSGTINFSKLEKPALRLTNPQASHGGRLRVWAKSYNVLRIMGGMAALAFVA